MDKALSFVRLDLLTVKPYFTWKQLLIFSFAPIAMIMSSDINNIATTIFMIFGMFGMLFAGYPFAIGEKNNADALYIILSIKRDSVVFGRYLFSVMFNLFAGLTAYIFIFAAFLINKQTFNFKEILIIMLVFFIVYTVIQAIQLPIFFKFGYAKAKLLVYLPFAGIPAIVFIFGNFIIIEKIYSFYEWVLANQAVTAAIAGVIWLIVMAVSYYISLSCYNKREF
jgi:hypothetical protein